MQPPKLEFALSLHVNVGPIQEIGITGKGMRKAVALLGGTFKGPLIQGEVVPGGYDFQLIRNVSVAEIDARYLLKTDDGALITIENKGLRDASAEVMSRLAKGEEVPPDQYYFRTVPVFETSEKKYEWLTKSIFIANGIRKPDHVVIEVWKVL